MKIDRYAALANFLKDRSVASFVWGENDCCVFAADAVLVQTGRDPMHRLRGSYDDEAGAARILSKPGGLRDMVSAWLPGEPLPLVTIAQRGDVVLFESGAGPALGICVGDKFAAVSRDGGIGYFSMRHALTAWRVE